MIALAAVFVLAADTAVPSLGAEDILKKADARANDYKDQRFVMTMTIEGSGVKKIAKMETLQKGGEKRLVRFLAPGDVKGTALLLEGKNGMYMYMPQFQKVRRIATHAKSQGFMDSDFTNDDMGTVNYSTDYSPALVETADKTTEKSYRLKLTPKPGADAAVEALEVLVDRESFIITQIDYIQSGKAVRRQTRGEVKTFPGGFMTPTVITMEDLTKAHKTTIVMDDVKINSGLTDDLFTKQALERVR